MNDLDLVCLSHLRWGFVYQRPNHLMSRSARSRRTFFFEEPVFDAEEPNLELRTVVTNLTVAVPHLRADEPQEETNRQLRRMLDQLYQLQGIRSHILWFYTPMALDFAHQLRPRVTVYDCMDELSGFDGAHPEMAAFEKMLFRRADLVFTGGQSLYEAKRDHHPNVHAFPSSVDREHFATARTTTSEPADQAGIPRPRLGYFGVIDERLDLALLGKVADAHPEWQLIMVGPVVKIDPETLPKRANIHYLGPKQYQELPQYLAGWDVALMPFALNAATKFISPTKTLEYLAAGKPVVSTAIRDVVRPYGERGLVRIGDQQTFVQEIEACLKEDPEARRSAADAFVAQTSWDKTFERMEALVMEKARSNSLVGADQPMTEERSVPCSIT